MHCKGKEDYFWNKTYVEDTLLAFV